MITSQEEERSVQLIQVRPMEWETLWEDIQNALLHTFSITFFDTIRPEALQLLKESTLSMKSVIERVVARITTPVTHSALREHFNLEKTPFIISKADHNKAGYTVHNLQRDSDVRLSYQVIFLIIFRPYIPMKYPTLESFLKSYPEFRVRISLEQNLLHHTAEWINLCFYTLKPANNKGFFISLIPRIVEGPNCKYVTGSGETTQTADRVTVFRREGNCVKIQRLPRKRARVEPRPSLMGATDSTSGSFSFLTSALETICSAPVSDSNVTSSEDYSRLNDIDSSHHSSFLYDSADVPSQNPGTMCPPRGPELPGSTSNVGMHQQSAGIDHNSSIQCASSFLVSPQERSMLGMTPLLGDIDVAPLPRDYNDCTFDGSDVDFGDGGLGLGIGNSLLGTGFPRSFVYPSIGLGYGLSSIANTPSFSHADGVLAGVLEPCKNSAVPQQHMAWDKPPRLYSIPSRMGAMSSNEMHETEQYNRESAKVLTAALGKKTENTMSVSALLRNLAFSTGPEIAQFSATTILPDGTKTFVHKGVAKSSTSFPSFGTNETRFSLPEDANKETSNEKIVSGHQLPPQINGMECLGNVIGWIDDPNSNPPPNIRFADPKIIATIRERLSPKLNL